MFLNGNASKRLRSTIEAKMCSFYPLVKCQSQEFHVQPRTLMYFRCSVAARAARLNSIYWPVFHGCNITVMNSQSWGTRLDHTFGVELGLVQALPKQVSNCWYVALFRNWSALKARIWPHFEIFDLRVKIRREVAEVSGSRRSSNFVVLGLRYIRPF